MINFLIAGILLLIVGLAAIYIVKAKKSGVKCIGCPSGGNCSGKKGRQVRCSCECLEEETE